MAGRAVLATQGVPPQRGMDLPRVPDRAVFPFLAP